jgi:hypothetical protein
MRKKSLKWGETPWDNMSQEELLREVQRIYSACRSLYSVVRMDADMKERFGGNTVYYSQTGVGGAALEKGRQVIDALFEKYKEGEHDLFSSFFRYADDLLFDTSTGYDFLRKEWHICTECRTMLGENSRGRKLLGAKCSDVFGLKTCNGTYRLITWDDLKKK